MVVPWIPCATATQNKNAQAKQDLHQKREDPNELPPLPADPEERKREAACVALVTRIRGAAQKEVEAAASSVPVPDIAALAKALRVETAPPDSEALTRSAIRVLDDLDSDGTPEVAFRWSRAERFRLADPDVGPVPGWVMFLLSWDNARWRATELTPGDGLSGVETLPGLWPADGIVVVDGLAALPFPVIFEYKDHTATMAWDSRADQSLYQSYEQGTLQFQDRESGPPVMIVSGRADPGVISFRLGGRRGFDAATVFFWEQGAYVPKRTEYEDSEDYTLYRFLAALHIRDFKAAFACVDPAKFLDGRASSPDALRKAVVEVWPEFVGNSLFMALENYGGNAFAFVLERGHERTIYLPTFSADGKLLLTGLQRRMEK